MAKLEHASWIAGIVSAVLAAGGVVWGVWTYVWSPPAVPPGAPVGMDPSFLKELEANAARQKRFMQAREAASYAQTSVSRGLNKEQRKVYDAAAQKMRDAMHLGQLGGRDEEALKLYREARELFESLR